jgi:hypothetical protein
MGPDHSSAPRTEKNHAVVLARDAVEEVAARQSGEHGPCIQAYDALGGGIVFQLLLQLADLAAIDFPLLLQLADLGAIDFQLLALLAVLGAMVLQLLVHRLVFAPHMRDIAAIDNPLIEQRLELEFYRPKIPRSPPRLDIGLLRVGGRRRILTTK